MSVNRSLILIVEDEEDIAELIGYNLRREQFDTILASSGREAVSIAIQKQPDLILLDLMLPDQSGYDICRQIRSNPKLTHTPIIMLTAKGEESDIVTGLELGADDYITKPFVNSVLLARIRAIMRRKSRAEPSADNIVESEGIKINVKRHEVWINNTLADLTATEFKILHFMLSHRGWVFTRDQIIKEVHGTDYPVTLRSIDVQITGLRKKMGELGENIETIRGVGYRYKD